MTDYGTDSSKRADASRTALAALRERAQQQRARAEKMRKDARAQREAARGTWRGGS